VKAELGRFPVENFINSQAILYLARLHTDNLNPLLKEAFELSKSCIIIYLFKRQLLSISENELFIEYNIK
jgi:hypothetical protein